MHLPPLAVLIVWIPLGIWLFRRFPVRIAKAGWAHSLAFTEDVHARFEATPSNVPFVIHLAEGTDRSAAAEIFRLYELGALDCRTVIVHAVGLTPAVKPRPVS